LTRDIDDELIAYTDTNSRWDANALNNLVSYMNEHQRCGYLSGRLVYDTTNDVAESKYWSTDLKLREFENIYGACVGGNGAIYCIRASAYSDFPAHISHDGYMPANVVVKGYSSNFCKSAVAFEKETNDKRKEFRRKIRMNRGQPFKKYFIPSKFNLFRYPYFTVFFIAHKYFKYLFYLLIPLWLLVFGILSKTLTYLLILFVGVVMLLGVLGLKTKLYQYLLTLGIAVLAQWIALYNTLKGDLKVTWDVQQESIR